MTFYKPTQFFFFLIDILLCQQSNRNTTLSVRYTYMQVMRFFFRVEALYTECYENLRNQSSAIFDLQQALSLSVWTMNQGIERVMVLILFVHSLTIL